MIHNKHHWDYKSFMTPQAKKSVKSLCIAPSCFGPKRFLELQNLNIPQFYKSSYTTAVRYKRVPNCSAQLKQQKNNGRKCRKRSPTDRGNYYITHAVCT